MKGLKILFTLQIRISAISKMIEMVTIAVRPRVESDIIIDSNPEGAAFNMDGIICNKQLTRDLCHTEVCISSFVLYVVGSNAYEQVLRPNATNYEKK